MASNNGEPSSAPQPERWYNLRLGSTFKDQSSTKFCTLRYEFKPASIDKSQGGSLHKNKENRVTVEFPNNQPGKPKVTFEGSSEDYKDNDGVLFFDGETFRLERLHRSVKRLRHVRPQGESTAAAAISATSAGTGTEPRSPPVGKVTNKQSASKLSHAFPVEVERIDLGEPESPGPKAASGNTSSHRPLSLDPFSRSPDSKPYQTEENMDEEVDLDDHRSTPNKTSDEQHDIDLGFDITVPYQNDMDDEIANVDESDDEANKGTNAAEALRAQVNAEDVQQETSSSSDSSGSGSSGSGSGSGSSSSSSDSDGSDNDSASSGGDIEI